MGAGSSAPGSGSSVASAQLPNAACSMFRPHPVVVKAFGSEKVLVWKLISERGYHTIRLEHDVFTGRRLILADGVAVYAKARTLLDTGSTHAFVVAGMRCQVQIVEQGLQFGYALTINDQPFARFRAEFWKYAALWYLPRNGRLTPRTGSGVWPEAAASAAATSAYAHAAALPTAAVPASSEPTSPASSSSPAPRSSTEARAIPPSPSTIPRFHTVVVMSHPQLTVLLNGRVVDLQSFFSNMSEHDAGLPEHESTTHAFVLPRGEDDDADAVDVHCQLQVWIDKNDAPLSAGQIQNHVPRDKRHGRNRYALRMGGTLVAQAPSPLVGVHGSLQNSTASASSGASAPAATSAPQIDPATLSPTQPQSDLAPRSIKPVPSPVAIPPASPRHDRSAPTNVQSPTPPEMAQAASDFGMMDVHSPIPPPKG